MLEKHAYRHVSVRELSRLTSRLGVRGSIPVPEGVICEVPLRELARLVYDEFGVYQGITQRHSYPLIVENIEEIRAQDIRYRYGGYCVINGRFYFTDGLSIREVRYYVYHSDVVQTHLGSSQ